MNDFITVNIVPTGIGCSIGGFAGDSNPVNSVLESVSDIVITHPNAVNAASIPANTGADIIVKGLAHIAI